MIDQQMASTTNSNSTQQPIDSYCFGREKACAIRYTSEGALLGTIEWIALSNWCTRDSPTVCVDNVYRQFDVIVWSEEAWRLGPVKIDRTCQGGGSCESVENLKRVSNSAER